ncbi:MAG: hydrolase [Sphingobacteriaceae bacterium]|nr:hydrolase [Sphingobacteriaceae bacterium]
MLTSFTFAQASSIVPPQDTSPQVMTWKVGDSIRQALVYIPASAKNKAAPLIFNFHGHGGRMQRAYDQGFQKLWPEAIVVCPQGLNTPGALSDKEGKRSGWQNIPEIAKNRDLQFFDVMLKSLQTQYKVDKNRIYATGHSNGGWFTYLLWAVRGDVFAAVAPSSAIVGAYTPLLKPKPAMHIMGEKDPLVKPAMQLVSINSILRLNQCEKEGEEIGRYTKYYESKSGNPVVTFIHPGGHVYSPEAAAAVVNFFKGQVKK